MSAHQELIAAAMRVCDMEAGSTKTPPELKAAIARLRQAVAAMKRRGPDVTFETFSGVSMQTSRPFVELRGPELPLTMEAKVANELGLSLIEAAVTAETEATLVAELRANDLGDEVLAALLGGMRRRRQDAEAKEE